MKIAPPKNERARKRLETRLALGVQTPDGRPCRAQIYRTRFGWAARFVPAPDADPPAAS